MSRFWLRRAAAEEEGQAIVLMAIVLMALIFAIGLAADAGTLYAARRTQREATDAAAWAAAVVLYLTPPPIDSAAQTLAVSAARTDATRNGYTDNTNGVRVYVNAPPSTGPFSTDNRYVEVIITQNVRTPLVPQEAGLTFVQTRAVAGAAGFQSGFAIVALKTSSPCIQVTNTGGITVPNTPPLGGGVQANCPGNGAIDLGGTGGITDALGVFSVGTINNPGRVVGPITQPAPTYRDPFAGFPKPPGAPPTTVRSNSQYTVPTSACNSATPLQPGVYIGGIYINLDPATCPNAYLATGVYILQGGGMNQDSQTGQTIKVVPGGGAMLFNTHSAYPTTPVGSCGSIQAQQGGKIDIQSMTSVQSPNYFGMALYQDAACTNSIDVQSNGALNLHGTLYAPTAQLGIQAQSSATIDAQIVVASINLGSQGSLIVNYDASASAQTLLPALVE